MTDPVLRLDGLVKSFGATRAVDDLSLSVERGEFFALLGPSGCGKTTTLRMVTGLERPDRGRVRIDGVDATDAPPARRDVHLVFQDLVLFPHMTVAENVAYGLERAGWDRDRREARVADLLSVVGLPDAGERDPAELSGGQRQRVALARSLAPEPSVLLLDEPLSSLDRRLREELRTELQRIQSEVGTTFVYVTHDQESAMRLADRLAVMRDGRLAEVGPPERLYERPRTEFVARFFSDANVLTGTVDPGAGPDGASDHDGARPRVRVRGQSVPLATPVRGNGSGAGPGHGANAGSGAGVDTGVGGGVPDAGTGGGDDGTVTVVVRPAAVAVGAGTGDDADDGDDALPATVRAAAYRGEGYEYDLALADGQVVRARTGTGTRAGTTERARGAAGRLDPGTETTVRFREAAVVRPDGDGDGGDGGGREAPATATDGGAGGVAGGGGDGDA